MAGKPKLRIFAGPNGSGKTTLFESIKETYFSTRLFVNADLLEDSFGKNGFINLSQFDIEVKDTAFKRHLLANGLYKLADFNSDTWNLQVKENVLVPEFKIPTAYNSYHFAIVADFIRHELIRQKKSFSFETVFSHSSKLDIMDLAKENNYKVYLYFVGTETPSMNIERVKDRVEKGGHAVSDSKVEKRYFATMELLSQMVKKADEFYLWDNSGRKHVYVGNVSKGIAEFSHLTIPAWVDRYLLKKMLS